MIELQNFTTGFKNRTLLEDVCAVFPDGALTALLGRNGTGKSTLLRAVAGLNKNYSGNIVLDGTCARRLGTAGMARALAFVSTERTRIPSLRCRDVVAMGRAPYTNWTGRMQEQDKVIVEQALADVGMTEYSYRTMNTMSDGECQRVMIARALAQDTPNIVLDEPTSFLDLPNRYALCRLLARLAHERGKCIVFSTHELDIAMALADNIALISPPDLEVAEAQSAQMAEDIKTLFEIG